MKKLNLEIVNLEVDCKIGKDRHFIAADRKNKWRIRLGLFAVIGAAILASDLNGYLINLLGVFWGDENTWKPYQLVFSRILPLLVGISTSILSFFGLEKQISLHRNIGNEYIAIARKSRALINKLDEEKDKTLENFEKLKRHYMDVNKEGESCPTNDKDSEKAMKMNSRKRKAIKNKIRKMDEKEMDLPIETSRSKETLSSIVIKGLKFLTARFLTSIKIIRKTDYRNYIKNI